MTSLLFNVKCWISPVDTTPVQLADIGIEAPKPFLKWKDPRGQDKENSLPLAQFLE